MRQEIREGLAIVEKQLQDAPFVRVRKNFQGAGS